MSIFRICEGIYQGGLPDESCPAPLPVTVVLSLIDDSEWHRVVAAGQDAVSHHAVIGIRMPILDGARVGLAWLRSAVGVVRAVMDQGHSVLIHCRCGVSRSVMVAAACLMAEGDSWWKAIERVREANTEADPAPAFMALLMEYEKWLNSKRSHKD